MIPLKTTFYSRKYHHRQLKRRGKVALFERFHEDLPDWVHYEVVVIHSDPDRVMHGHPVPAHERYPGAEEWGRFGFTFEERAQAERKFAELSDKE